MYKCNGRWHRPRRPSPRVCTLNTTRTGQPGPIRSVSSPTDTHTNTDQRLDTRQRGTAPAASTEHHTHTHTYIHSHLSEHNTVARRHDPPCPQKCCQLYTITSQILSQPRVHHRHRSRYSHTYVTSRLVLSLFTQCMETESLVTGHSGAAARWRYTPQPPPLSVI